MKEELPEEDQKLSSFKRGNVNFDLLRPEGGVIRVERSLPDGSFVKKSKRGQFESGRKSNPVGKFYIFFWFSVFSGSLLFLGFLTAGGTSLFWLTGLPIALSSLVWSLVMLSLIFARPR